MVFLQQSLFNNEDECCSRAKVIADQLGNYLDQTVLSLYEDKPGDKMGFIRWLLDALFVMNDEEDLVRAVKNNKITPAAVDWFRSATIVEMENQKRRRRFSQV